MPTNSVSPEPLRLEKISRGQPIRAIYAGCALTGLGTALLGCALPVLTRIWHLSDAHAGFLFAAQFSGSALGALLIGRNYFASLRGGYLLTIVSALCIGVVPIFPRTLLFLGFGLGLGLTMTATSMVVGTLYARTRGQALSLLNGFWTIGAALCPVLTSIWVDRWSPILLFASLGSAMAIVFLLLFTPRPVFSVPSSGVDAQERRTDLRFIVVFATLGFLYVGVEASVGGWLMTYVQRFDVNRVWAPMATSCFWISLLCGRMLAPLVLLRIKEPRLLTSCIFIALMSTGLMVLSSSPLMFMLTASLTGLSLGPIFPLCIANALATIRDGPRAKWVFSIAGFGGAIFPWITGSLSSYESSLRVGLLVPVFALGGMMLLDRLQAAFAPPAPAPVQGISMRLGQ